jgi:glycosyltransferase involved in cell wall biosynthesis
MSMIPKVSICLPNLNHRQFLEERIATIFAQTLRDWELIVCDSYSEDGAWAFFQSVAAKDSRVRIAQIPREGLYAGWNHCIKRAGGEYIYIATSDDTMSPDCLQKLVGAIERNPGCDLAHCCLTFIDEAGQPVTGRRTWGEWATVKYYGKMIKVEHVRFPGHDTILGLALKTPYYSITQLLIRKDLFSKIGLFETRWGPFGDLEWQMRAALVAKTVHVPEYLATWRIHPKQASQVDRFRQAVWNGGFLEIADSVIQFSRDHDIPCPGGLPRRLRRFFWIDHVGIQLAAERRLVKKAAILLRSCPYNIDLLGYFIKVRFWARIMRQPIDMAHEILRELRRIGIPQPWPTGLKSLL